MMTPRIFQPAEQKGKTAATVSKANAQILRQLVERATQNHRDDCQLRLRWHAHGPGHHVVRHALPSHHVPGMNQHRRAFVSTMMQKRYNAGVVEILLSNMVSNLHSQVSCVYASS